MERNEELAAIYRAPMRARSFDSGLFQGARLGTERGIVGIGEPLRETPETLDQAIRALAAKHSEKSARMLSRFAGLPEGTLVWTRTDEDVFRLGELSGPWWYDDSEAAGRTGIHQVRSAIWIPGAFDPESVPPAVLETFRRGGKNLQRIRDEDAEVASNRLWQEATTRS